MRYSEVIDAFMDELEARRDNGACAKPGRRFTRRDWNGKGQWIALQVPDMHSKMTLPYIYMRNAQGELIPWLCSQGDALSDQWMEVME